MTQSFQANRRAESSGIYRVIHANSHIPAHYVLVLDGDIFPN